MAVLEPTRMVQQHVKAPSKAVVARLPLQRRDIVARNRPASLTAALELTRMAQRPVKEHSKVAAV